LKGRVGSLIVSRRDGSVSSSCCAIVLDHRKPRCFWRFFDDSLLSNAELPFRFSRAQQLSVGVYTNISVGADHQSPRRNDYEGYLGYSANLTRAFTINAVGRVVARDYHQNGRTDVSEILSATATYYLTNWCSVSAISSFAHSDSNQDVFDYNVANVGGAIALSAKF
jgi:hypothetical protein